MIQQEKGSLHGIRQKAVPQRRPFFRIDEEEPGVLRINYDRQSPDLSDHDEPIANFVGTKSPQTTVSNPSKCLKSQKGTRISPISPVPITSTVIAPAF